MKITGVWIDEFERYKYNEEIAALKSRIKTLTKVLDHTSQTVRSMIDNQDSLVIETLVRHTEFQVTAKVKRAPKNYPLQVGDVALFSFVKTLKS
jgi:hypothetical protein